jgi:hypothetical protein
MTLGVVCDIRRRPPAGAPTPSNNMGRRSVSALGQKVCFLFVVFLFLSSSPHLWKSSLRSPQDFVSLKEFLKVLLADLQFIILHEV